MKERPIKQSAQDIVEDCFEDGKKVKDLKDLTTEQRRILKSWYQSFNSSNIVMQYVLREKAGGGAWV